MARDITQAEKAALYYHLVGKCNDWEQLYKIAKGEEAFNKLSTASKSASVSKWKNSDAIQAEIKNISYLVQKEQEEAQERAVQAFKDNQEKEDGKGNLAEINFLDRDEFLSYLNKQANRIQDEKSRNETLKMISDNLRYKDMDREKEGDEDIRRFYTPMVCNECPLYLRCQKCPLDECPNA